MSITLYNKGFNKKNTDYMTPDYAWLDIDKHIPDDKIIWSPFYGDGTQKKIFKNMGYNIIHKNKDFFSYTPKYDLIIDNPPFFKFKDILNRLKELDKPFILLMPTGKLSTKYFKKFQKNNPNKIQLIIPKRRINFIKYINGRLDTSLKPNGCNFDCYYYCYKMNLDKDINWV
jgi:hypothetical protein